MKVITDKSEDAIYFSRFPVPYNRDQKKQDYYKHIGIYGYTKDFLKCFALMKRSGLETCEGLEQLRVLENGYKIRVRETKYESVSVDLPEHIMQVEKLLQAEC